MCFNVGFNRKDGSTIWEVPSIDIMDKRAVGDADSFYFVGFNAADRKSKVISSDVRSGKMRWRSEFGDLISKLYLDDRRLTALAWFDNEEGINVYALDISDGKASKQISLPIHVLTFLVCKKW